MNNEPQNGAVASTRKKRQVLKRGDSVRVALWLTANWEKFKATPMRMDVLIDRVYEALKIQVVDGSAMRRLCKDAALEVDEILIQKVVRGANNGGLLRRLATQLALTQLALQKLCTQIGEPFDPDNALRPQWLRDIACGKTSLGKYPQPQDDASGAR